MRKLLFVVAFLAVALGVTLILWESPREGERGAARATTTSSAAALPGEAAQLTPPIPGESASSGRSAVSRREVVEPGVQGAGSSEAARGARIQRVHGSVVDRGGNPVADAVVLASDSAFGALDLERPVEWMEVTKTRTDGDGSFSIEGVSPKSLRLAVRAPGFAPLDRDRFGLPDEEEVFLEPLVLERGAILSGRVVNDRGQAVADARLIAVSSEQDAVFFRTAERTPAAITDVSGRFRIDQIAVGPWKLKVDHPAHPPKSFEGVTSDADPELGGLEFQLESGGTITGRAVGLPEGAQLQVTAVPAGGSFALEAVREANLMPGGDFVLGGLDPELVYELRLFPRGSGAGFLGEVSLSRTLRARPGESGVLLQYEQASELVLRLVDAKTGDALEDLTVEAGVNWGRPIQRQGEPGQGRFPDGVVRIKDLHMTSAGDRLVLEVKCPGFEPFELKDVRLEPGEVRDLGDVLLQPVPVYAVTVLDANTRAPIAGAKVEARESLPESGAGEEGGIRHSFSFSLEGEGDGDGDLSPHLLSDRASSKGETDADGRAILNTLGVERVAISARAKGYARTEVDAVQEGDGGTTPVTLLLSKGGSVLVTVLEADGSPAAGRSVEHRGPNSNAEQEFIVIGGGIDPGERTDGRGQVLFENLELGSHRFRIAKKSSGGTAFGGGFASLVIGSQDEQQDSSWTALEVVWGPTQSLELIAAPSGNLSGVITEAGLPLAGATLALSARAGESDGGSSARFDLSGLGVGAGPQVRTGARGDFLFEDLEQGTYTLRVQHATRRMPTIFEVEVEAGENNFDADLPVSVLAGRVSAKGGGPVAGALVSVRRAQDPSRPSGQSMIVMTTSAGGAISISGGGSTQQATTDEEGRFVLRGVQADTPLTVHVESPDYRPTDSEPIEVAPNETRDDVHLELVPGGHIAVRTRSAAGANPGGMLVVARLLDDPEQPPSSGVLDGGACELTGLVPGLWSVSLRGFGDQSEDPDPKEVEVVAGETVEALFDLP